MQLDMSSASLPVYEALSSEVRLHIIRLISEKPMSVKELAQELGLSSAIVTKHLDKLAAAELVTSKRVGRSKMTELRVDTIEVKFPREIYPTFQVHQTSIPYNM